MLFNLGTRFLIDFRVSNLLNVFFDWEAKILLASLVWPVKSNKLFERIEVLKFCFPVV